jgi:hypothetical protein
MACAENSWACSTGHGPESRLRGQIEDSPGLIRIEFAQLSQNTANATMAPQRSQNRGAWTWSPS